MKSFHPVTKALSGSWLPLECDLKKKKKQTNSNRVLLKHTPTAGFFSQRFFPSLLSEIQHSLLVLKAILDLRLRLLCRESPQSKSVLFHPHY